MEMRHLSGFVAVAEELHFGRAARRLHLSQPAVSRLIRQLESEVATVLFERSTRHVALTPNGKAFLDEARTALEHFQAVGRCVAGGSRGRVGGLRVGHTGCTEELLPVVLRRLRRRMASVAIDVRQVDRALQEQQLLESEVDIVTRRASVQHAALVDEVVGTEPVMIALPFGHPFAALAAIPLARLAETRFVLLPGSPSHDCLLRLCRSAGFEPEVASETGSLCSLGVLVASGVGVALVPGSISARFNSGEVVYRPVDDPAASLPVVVAWRRGEQSPAVHGFLQAIRPAVTTRTLSEPPALAVSSS